MEEKNSCVRAGFSTILWGILAILLCAAPCVWAVDVPAVETWDIPSEEHPSPVTGNLWVYGTANLLPGAHITQELGAYPGSTVNIYGGQVDWWLVTYTSGDPTDNPSVTVYGREFTVDDKPVEPSEIPINGELKGCYENGNPISLLIYSGDVPITLAAPGGGVTQVEIDIKPGSDLNPINPGSNGLIPVAILTTADFDAADVDPATVTLAGAEVAVRGKAEKLMARLEDVDGDGDDDLLLQVETQSDGALWESGTVTLTGKTYDGQDIKGTDEVIIVPPEG